MLENIAKGFSSVFAIAWFIIILIEYWQNNLEYSRSIQYFQYSGLAIFFLLLAGLASWGITKIKKKPVKSINGLTIFAGLLILDTISLLLFYNKFPSVTPDFQGVLMHLSYFTGLALAIFSIYLVARVSGKMLTFIFPLKIARSDLPIIQTAIGISAMTFLLFFLGIFGFLKVWVVAPLLLLILIINWQESIQIVQSIFLKPLELSKDLNALGIFTFLFLGVFLVFDFTHILRPFPTGADAIRIYANLPKLIGDYGALVDGFQPYNWSLFMSYGTVVFQRIDVMLGLSFLGGLLSLGALYRLSRKWLTVNQSALCLLLFGSLPMTNFLWYKDMKIDMGLLFITLCILLLFYNWVNPSKEEEGNPTVKNNKSKKSKAAKIVQRPVWLVNVKQFFADRIPLSLKENRLLVAMGFLTGFAFGIKLTALFFFFALVSVLWYKEAGFRAFLSAFFLLLGSVFLLKLDEQPQLRNFHDNVFPLQLILLSVGIGLLVHLFLKQKESMVRILNISMIIGFFFLLPVLPWIGKNISETGSLSVEALLNGKKATPIPDKVNSEGNNEFVMPGLYAMPNVQEVETRTQNKEIKDDVRIDLHRFMGSEILPSRYLSLPYDTFQHTNVPGSFNDVGFLLLLLLPILFVLSNKETNPLTNYLFIALCLLMLIVSIPSAFMNKHHHSSPNESLTFLSNNPTEGTIAYLSNGINKAALKIYSPIHHLFSNISGSKDSFTYPLLIVLFLGILFLLFQRISNYSKTTKTIVLFLANYFFFWWILGSGAAWYGMLLFCVPFIFLIKGMIPNSDKFSLKNLKPILGKPGILFSSCLIWLFFAFTYRTISYNPINEEIGKYIYIPAFIEYQTGSLTEDETLNSIYPNMVQIRSILNEEKESLIYLVAAPQVNFFVEKNDSRIFSDTFLGFFNKMVNKFKNKRKVTEALRAKGFKYIAFSLNLSEIDQTKDKILTRKFTNFLNTLYNNPDVELILTDRTIRRNSDGQLIYAVFPTEGAIESSGSLAIFKIK